MILIFILHHYLRNYSSCISNLAYDLNAELVLQVNFLLINQLLGLLKHSIFLHYSIQFLLHHHLYQRYLILFSVYFLLFQLLFLQVHEPAKQQDFSISQRKHLPFIHHPLPQPQLVILLIFKEQLSTQVFKSFNLDLTSQYFQLFLQVKLLILLRPPPYVFVKPIQMDSIFLQVDPQLIELS